MTHVASSIALSPVLALLPGSAAGAQRFLNVFTVLGAVVFLWGLFRLLWHLVRGVAAALSRARTLALRKKIAEGKLREWPDGVAMYLEGTVRARLRRALLFPAVMVLSAPLFYVGLTLGEYTAFGTATEVMKVSARTTGPSRMRLEITRPGAQRFREVAVEGGYWFAEGDFFVFPRWVGYLGLRSGVKMTRIIGLTRRDDLLHSAAWHPVALRRRDFLFSLASKVPVRIEGLHVFSGQTPLESPGQKSIAIVAGRMGFAVY